MKRTIGHPASGAARDQAMHEPAKGMLNIGQAAAASGVSAKMIRYYEAQSLLPEIRRTEAGYRQYGPDDVNTLRFIRRARDLGFSIDEIGTLLSLWRDRGRASREVKRVALAHVADLQRRIDEMQAMRRTLQQLAAACHGDARPSCPILDDLAGQPPAPDEHCAASARARTRARSHEQP